MKHLRLVVVVALFVGFRTAIAPTTPVPAYRWWIFWTTHATTVAHKRFTELALDQPDDDVFIKGMLHIMAGYVQRAEGRFFENMKIKQLLEIESIDERVAFEKGYLMGEIIETYRKALVFTEKQMVKKRYLESERIRYLTYVQNAYIKVHHLVHMMHEINAKYGADNTGQIQKLNLGKTSHVKTPTFYKTAGFNYAKELDEIRNKLIKERQQKVDRETKIRNYEFEVGKVELTPTIKKTTNWFPMQYGWDMDYYW